ncbi:MAG TPA: hypothetical protein VJ112_04160 [Rhabdochlamydiaceae bacterium]|nr:hypothetical protein [Rhabdochlamydiaceae bacterium]
MTSANEGINVAIQNFSPNFSRKYFEKFPELSIVITIALAYLFSRAEFVVVIEIINPEGKMKYKKFSAPRLTVSVSGGGAGVDSA